MATAVDSLRVLLRQLRSRRASSVFINGAPGSGKSYHLQWLAQNLPHELGQRVTILGPYTLTHEPLPHLTALLASDLHAAGYVGERYPDRAGLDLPVLWQWIETQAQLPREQTFIVLSDLPDRYSDGVSLGNLFSSARYFEGAWEGRMRIQHVFAGYWQHPEMVQYFTRIRTSFPYTRTDNYLTWSGLTVDETTTLVLQLRSSEARPFHGPLLYELCGGHPAAMQEILGSVGSLSTLNLFVAARQAAQQGAVAQCLVAAWQALPAEALNLVGLLLTRRYVAQTFMPELIDQLQASGIVRSVRAGAADYLTFRSWYVELIIRLHAADLHLPDREAAARAIDDLIPEVSALHVEAYRLIHDLENTARNFAALYLRAQQPQSEALLVGRALKQDQVTGIYEDAQVRASEWRLRSSSKGVPIEVNPALAFLGTRDLALLLADIAAELKSVTWEQAAQPMLELADVRDAVMHHQLIDDSALTRLLDLRMILYRALNESLKR